MVFCHIAFSSSSYSRSGNSVTHRNLNSLLSSNPSFLAISTLSCPSESNTTSFLSAIKHMRSPGSARILVKTALISSSVKNLVIGIYARFLHNYPGHSLCTIGFYEFTKASISFLLNLFPHPWHLSPERFLRF